MRKILAAVPALLAVSAWAVPAHAELVYFHTGRALSVRALRSDGDLLILHLRGGGEVTCERSLISRVEPDEVEYPAEELEAAPAAARIFEAPAVPSRYRKLIASAAAKHGVDARLVEALIYVESGYRNRAVSRKGARGLMQILPSTGRQYGALDLFNPQVNVDAGVRHLKSLLERFELPIALAAYNAGAGAVTRFGGIPPFRETRNYVTRILGLLDGARPPS